MATIVFIFDPWGLRRCLAIRAGCAPAKRDGSPTPKRKPRRKKKATLLARSDFSRFSRKLTNSAASFWYQYARKGRNDDSAHQAFLRKKRPSPHWIHLTIMEHWSRRNDSHTLGAFGHRRRSVARSLQRH